MAFLLVALLSPVYGITIKSVSTDSLSPGESGEIRVEIENTLGADAKDISFSLTFNGLPFIPLGSSEDALEELDEDDDEELSFEIKAANDIEPGDYEIHYTLEYSVDNEHKKRTGSIGVRVEAHPDLIFSLSTDKPVIGNQDRISLKIVNKGFADAKFVSVKIVPEGFTLLSEEEVYIGTIDSDDFETADFDVIYRDQHPLFSAMVEYTDFDNERVTENVRLPVTVYTQEKAVELGFVEKNNAPFYIGIVIAIVLVFILYRMLRKRARDSRRKREKAA